METFRRSISALCLALLLSACGGGGGDGGGAAPAPVITDPEARIARAQQDLLLGDTVTLDGSSSVAPTSGPALTYQWTLSEAPEDSTARLSSATSAVASFIPDKIGTYVASLVVTSGSKTSGPVTSTIAIKLENNPPVAIAGEDRTVVRGSTVQLDGSGSSDPDGDALMYRWEFNGLPPGSRSVLEGANTATPSFVADAVGNYQVWLTVYDAAGRASVSSGTTITVTKPDGAANLKPVGIIGYGNLIGVPSMEMERGLLYRLNFGSSYDLDGDTLTRPVWTLLSQPAGSNPAISESAGGLYRFTPDVDGNYVVQMVTSDGTVASDPVTITLVVKIGANNPPTAGVSTDSATVLVGTTAHVSSNSGDPDDDPLSYLWTLKSRPDTSGTGLNSTTEASTSFVPDRPGPYEVCLGVTDDRGLSSRGQSCTKILAKARNNPPIAGIAIQGYGNGTILPEGETQPLLVLPNTQVFTSADGSFDPDGDALYHLCEITAKPAGSTAELDYAAQDCSLTPDLPGDYAFRFVVSDGIVASSPVTLSLHVQAEDSYTGLRIEQNESNGLCQRQDDWTNRSLPMRWGYGTGSSETVVECTTWFRLTAKGRSYTIQNLAATSSDSGLLMTIAGLADGQVIADGQTVEFSITQPEIPDRATPEESFEWNGDVTFGIAETGETFDWTTNVSIY